MAMHVIVGGGQIGSATAAVLRDAGHSVRVVSRSGRGPHLPGIEQVALDATNTTALNRVAEGAAAIYNCANPPYHRWLTDWPPIAASLLSVAEQTGAVLVTMSNLYGYGPVDHPMVESDPLRATHRKGRVRSAMWLDALAAHTAGRVRVTEARASDYFGPGVMGTAHLGERVVPKVLAGKTIWVIGDPDAPHSWTYLPDIGRALAILGTDERALGRAWHVPTNPPASQRAVVQRMAALAGVRAPHVRGIPSWALRAGGLALPLLRELAEVYYQFDRPFVLDSSSFSRTFGVQPTPMDDALASTIAWWRQRPASAPARTARRGFNPTITSR